MLVAKVDANGNVVMGADGKPVMIEIPDDIQDGQIVEKRIAAARAEEKKKLYGDLEKHKTDVDRLQAELDRRDKEVKERQLAQLPQDQQVHARMKELEERIAKESGARMEAERVHATQLRQLGLVAYRERALRDVPSDVVDLVNGSNEEEIDRAAEMANRVYQNLEARLRSELMASHVQPDVPPAVQAPPPNPYYVPPISAAVNGFPTLTNAQPPVQTEQPYMEDLRSLTTEEAVRSGKYGGELREQLHARIKGNVRYPGTLGSAPRYWQQPQPLAVEHIAMPNGVMQPQGTPMSPPTPPGMHTPGPRGSDAHRAAAEAAVARTHQGTNPVVTGDAAANTALRSAQSFAQQRGVTPKSSFAARFTPTPPVSPNGQA